jgi:hypothetical protein
VAAVKAILVEVAAKNSLTFTVEEDALFLESLRDDTPFMSAADRLAQKTAELEEHLKPRGDDGPAAKPPARTVMMGTPLSCIQCCDSSVSSAVRVFRGCSSGTRGTRFRWGCGHLGSWQLSCWRHDCDAPSIHAASSCT